MSKEYDESHNLHISANNALLAKEPTLSFDATSGWRVYIPANIAKDCVIEVK